MGGKAASKAASREAKQARADEEARQARIRSGTASINSIFDGGTYGTGAVDAGAAYDPTKTYYNADGSVWTPTAATAAPGDTNHGGDLGKMFGSQGAAPSPGDNGWADALKKGLFIGTAASGGFNNDFFTKRRQAYIDYATPQLNDQHTDAQKQLTFALTRSGLLDSSARGQKAAELQKKYDLTRQQIADQALASEGEARSAIEDARSNLITTLNATGDATGAANSAIARASALSQPAAYSPLSNLFADFTSGLGTQAALERANYYSGGQTPLRYNTGLFTPGQSVSVKR